MQHHVAKLPYIMDKVKKGRKIWYSDKALENLWTRIELEHQIATNLYSRQALLENKISSYEETLPIELGKRALECQKIHIYYL